PPLVNDASADGTAELACSTSVVEIVTKWPPWGSGACSSILAATRALAVEYATRGIRSNAVALGIIRTPMHAPSDYDALGALQ
ncbi:3-oxoacyl-ACP reductase, partial [Mycobacterium sp. ITM-2017-0098]